MIKISLKLVRSCKMRHVEPSGMLQQSSPSFLHHFGPFGLFELVFKMLDLDITNHVLSLVMVCHVP